MLSPNPVSIGCRLTAAHYLPCFPSVAATHCCSPLPPSHTSRPAILPTTMNTSLNPTIQDVQSWNADELFDWIQENLSRPLNPEDEKKLKNARIDGITFLEGATSWDLFKIAD